MKSLGRITISSENSQQFAQASGDFNPLHLDPVAARRTAFGHTLIHGVCGTLKALDLLLGKISSAVSIASIQVKYVKPVTQGQELSVEAESTDQHTRLEISAAGTRCQIIEIELRHGLDAGATEELALPDEHREDTCVELGVADCQGLSGNVPLVWNNDIMTALFPNATKFLPKAQLASLLATTCIVGMKCPGLHSVFAQLSMQFDMQTADDHCNEKTQLNYRVDKTDPRIEQVELQIGSAHARGTIEAFFRKPPAQQASFEHIMSRVNSTEFHGQNALIIGASRGLGEVITKVLAAGGANTMMTYAAGFEDANRIADEISQLRSAPGVYPYNVLGGSLTNELVEFCGSLTHVYYLASPVIARGESNKWDRQLFERYCDFYVHGLARLLTQIRQCKPAAVEMHLFIPSSVFLEQQQKGFDEYIAAKAAAEAYVQRFKNAQPNWQVFAPRLPKLHTDQTAGGRGTSKEKTLAVMVEQLRQRYGTAASH